MKRLLAEVRAAWFCLRNRQYKPVRTRDALGRVVAVGASRCVLMSVVFWRAKPTGRPVKVRTQ
jgi:hypothetical protein